MALREGSNPGAQRGIIGPRKRALRDARRLADLSLEKYLPEQESFFGRTGKVVRLVHGGTRSGRSIYDLQIRDYSLMDFLARNDYDVSSIDIHGYGHSDKGSDWIDAHSAAADIASAVDYITKLRGLGKIDLFGASAGTQRAGVYAMEHPDKVAKLILHAAFWKATAEFREMNRKRIENGGQPLPRTRPTTEADFREGFVPGQFEQDVVEASVKVGMETDLQRPNVFVEYTKLPLLDSTRSLYPLSLFTGRKTSSPRRKISCPSIHS